MAIDKKSALIYTDWITIFEELDDCEAGQLIKHFMRYVNDLNPDPPSRLIKLVFEPIRQSLKRDLIKYETIRSKNKENAFMRWQNKNATASDRILNDAKHADSDNDSVSDNGIDSDKVIDKVIKIKRFTIPTIEDVIIYCSERKNSIDPNRWMDYYTSNGWMVGKNKMKDWKSAIRTWETNNNNNSQNGTTFNNTPKGKLAGNYKAGEDLAREMQEKSRNFTSGLRNPG